MRWPPANSSLVYPEERSTPLSHEGLPPHKMRLERRVRSGRNSYRNLASCCLECNSQKGQRRLADFLRSLYREQRLTASELKDRLRALDALAEGKLVPRLP